MVRNGMCAWFIAHLHPWPISPQVSVVRSLTALYVMLERGGHPVVKVSYVKQLCPFIEFQGKSVKEKHELPTKVVCQSLPLIALVSVLKQFSILNEKLH